MGKVFTSLLFKYNNTLYLGFLGDNGEIINFKTLNYSKMNEYNSLKMNEFIIVLVQQDDNDMVDFFEIKRVPIISEENLPEVVIGEIPNAGLFSIANQILHDDSNKPTLH